MHKTMNKIKNRLFRVLLLCAGTGLLVAGCSNDDDAPQQVQPDDQPERPAYFTYAPQGNDSSQER